MPWKIRLCKYTQEEGKIFGVAAVIELPTQTPFGRSWGRVLDVQELRAVHGWLVFSCGDLSGSLSNGNFKLATSSGVVGSFLPIEGGAYSGVPPRRYRGEGVSRV